MNSNWRVVNATRGEATDNRSPNKTQNSNKEEASQIAQSQNAAWSALWVAMARQSELGH
jgi:hypothetical protein